MTTRGIALCLSGGGFRASAYHLGTLDVLHRLGLLDQVRFLSSASGGTLLGARYLRSLVRGEPFAAFVQDTLGYLGRRNVLLSAAQKLGALPADGRARSIIVGAAETYAEADFLGDLTVGDAFAAQNHLEEIVFGATEFATGNAFRFQKSQAEAAVFGNGNHRVPDALAQRLRLADVAAASSAFPGGFEPLTFPQDFAFRDAAEREQALREWARPPLALMDGGIHDNQGFDGVLTAMKRKGVDAPELIFSSDVHQWNDPLYTPWAGPDLPALRVGLTLRLGGLWLLAVAGAGFWELVQAGVAAANHRWLEAAGRALIGAAAGAPVLYVAPKASAALEKAVAGSALPLRPTGEALEKLTLPEAVPLLLSRLNSLYTMASGVFMKRVRGLMQERVFGSNGGPAAVDSHVYGLLRDGLDTYPRSTVPISESARACLEAANAMATALWTTEPGQELKVFASGRINAVSTLLEWVAQAQAKGAALPSWAAALQAPLDALLRQLNDEPLFEVPTSAARPAALDGDR